jgi:hypothetical protein
VLEDQQTRLRRFTQEDMLASGIRMALSATGPFGVVLAEFATQLVPQQRLDRMQDFVTRLLVSTSRVGRTWGRSCERHG